MDEKDKGKFKPGTFKTPRLRNLGIITRVTKIKSNVNISEQAKIEVAKNIHRVQTNYSKKNVERVINGEHMIKLSKINTRGKPTWTAGVGEFKQRIFYNVDNE